MANSSGKGKLVHELDQVLGVLARVSDPGNLTQNSINPFL
jgi:hypothetical protein